MCIHECVFMCAHARADLSIWPLSSLKSKMFSKHQLDDGLSEQMNE